MKKKKNKYFILITLFVVIISSFSYYYGKKQVAEFKKITCLLCDDLDLTIYFSNPVVKYDRSTVSIELDVEENFDDLSAQEQFTLLELYNRQIRYFLKCRAIINHLYYKDYVITFQSKNSYYSFNSEVTNKNVPLILNSILKINNVIVYDTNRLEREQTPVNGQETVNGYTYEEIYNYANRIFNLISDNGILYYPDTDANIVIEAVMDKFGITFEEFDKVYKSYYFQSN